MEGRISVIGNRTRVSSEFFFFFFLFLGGQCKLIRDFVFPAKSCREKCGRIRGLGDRVVGKIAIRFSKREKQNWQRPRSSVRPNSKQRHWHIFFFFFEKSGFSYLL